MRFCSSCGAELKEGNKFCPGCGAPIPEIPAQIPVAPVTGPISVVNSGQASAPVGNQATQVVPNTLPAGQPAVPGKPTEPEKRFSPLPFIGFGLMLLAFIAIKAPVLSILLSTAGIVLSIIGAKSTWRLRGFGIAGIPMSAIALIAAIAVAASSSPSSGSDVSKASSGKSEDVVTDSVETKEDFIASCEKLDYKEVERNPQDFKGRRVAVTGTVVQANENTFWGVTTVTFRVAEKHDKIWYCTYTSANYSTRILEDDRVTLYGTCEGVETYETVLGTAVTIPAMTVKYFDFANN